MSELLRDAEELLGSAIQWEGRCYEIASRLASSGLVDGTPRYGLYYGEVVYGSIFYPQWLLVGWVRHGWLEAPNGDIVDPTRWSFEGVEPYIYRGSPGEEYDEGGNRMRARTRTLPPAPGAGIVPVPAALSGTLDRLGLVVGSDGVSLKQMHWLATLSLFDMGDMAEPIFRWICDSGHKCLIPIDNRRRVLGEEITPS